MAQPFSSTPTPAPDASRKPLPGPRGGLRVGPGELLSAYLEAPRQHGEIVCLNDERRVFLVSHPDHVKHVLQDNHTNYRQNVRKKVVLGAQSLALSGGEAWRQRRRLMQPMFNPHRLAGFAPGVVEQTGKRVDGWEGAARRGEPVDLAGEMVRLTLDILIEGLLGRDVDRSGLRRSVTTAFEYFNARGRSARTLPLSVPTPGNLRVIVALRALSGAVRKAVERHQKSPGEAGGDLLSMMLAFRDEQTGQVMSPEQIVDELMMLLVMGHMTTAMAITWTCHALAQNPGIDERMRAEIAEAIGDRLPAYGDLPRLTYTRMVVEESLRLYPPSWVFSRKALGDDEIGGYAIPAGSVLSISPWVTHRRPELWEEPGRFDPSRFEPDRVAGRPRFAYYPFGGGPRVCIAREMALMEIPLVLATVARRYRLRSAPGRPVVPMPAITLEPRGGLPMLLAPAGAPARALPSEALPALARLLARPAGEPAVLHKVDGDYRTATASELVDRVRRLAETLSRRGLAPGDRVAFLAGGGLDALAADLAVLALGGVTVPILPGFPPEVERDLVRRAAARFAFAEGDHGELPGVEEVFPLPADALLAEAPARPGELERRLAERRPEEPAVLAFTPGATGAPKGVLLTHGNLAAGTLALAEALDVRPGDVAFSLLPPAHVYERTLIHLYLLRGAAVAFAGSAETAAADLRRVRPHVMATVPDLWKGFLNGLFNTVQANAKWRQRLFRWAVAVGRRSLPWRLRLERPPGILGAKLAAAERLVFSVVRRPLGGRLRFAVSGGDRIPHGWITFLWAAGIPVYEGYGLTEVSPAVSVNLPRGVKPGTAGFSLPGTEVEIAPDGEILVRGPQVARQGWDGSSVPVDAEGWLHTGDAGFLDEAGRLTVLGRKQDLYANAEGRTVSPAGLERLLRSSHFVDQAVVVGAGRPHNAALLVPDARALERLARRRGIAAASLEELVGHPQVREVIGREIDGFNKNLAPHDKIAAWDLFPGSFTVEGGELTPAGTLRRQAVLEKHGELIERLRSPQTRP